MFDEGGRVAACDPPPSFYDWNSELRVRSLEFNLQVAAYRYHLRKRVGRTHPPAYAGGTDTDAS